MRRRGQQRHYSHRNKCFGYFRCENTRFLKLKTNIRNEFSFVYLLIKSNLHIIIINGHWNQKNQDKEFVLNQKNEKNAIPMTLTYYIEQNEKMIK